MPGLREAVELVRAGQGQVRDETRNLVNALRSSPKARGRWGEQSLRNVLEQAGLTAYADFQTEVSVDGEDGRLRPDVVVRLPGGRKLIIDAKCSLNAYLDACDEVDEDKRAACFRAHVASIRNHAQQLGSKAYWAQFGDAADYVVMYIPGEHFLTAALEQDPTLWEWAFERRVLLATPTNLVAIARTVASVWRAGEAATRRPRKSPPRQGVALAPCDHGPAYGAGRQEPLDRQRRLQPDGRQLRKPGVDPGAAVRDAGRRQRQGDRRRRRWSRRARGR